MATTADGIKIAHRYAKALFEHLLEEKNTQALLPQVKEDLFALRQTIEDVPELLKFITNPGIAGQAKQALVDQHIIASTSPLIGNLVRLMVDNDRLPVLPQVADEFGKMADNHLNLAQAEIVTVTPLSNTQEKQLGDTLAKLYGYTHVALQQTVDPSILGGVIVKIQDKIIDGSYAGRLRQLEKSIS